MIYRPANGSILSGEQAQQYGERLEILFASHNRELTAEDVLKDARKPESVMHDFFNWDDESAAEQYRLSQAKYLLRSIHVVIKREDNPDEELITRAIHHVHITEEEPQSVDGEEAPKEETRRVYVHINRILSEVDLRDQIIQEAMRQIVAWRARYKQYEELAEVHKAIAVVQEKLALAVV